MTASRRYRFEDESAHYATAAHDDIVDGLSLPFGMAPFLPQRRWEEGDRVVLAEETIAFHEGVYANEPLVPAGRMGTVAKNHVHWVLVVFDGDERRCSVNSEALRRAPEGA